MPEVVLQISREKERALLVEAQEKKGLATNLLGEVERTLNKTSYHGYAEQIHALIIILSNIVPSDELDEAIKQRS